MANNDNKKEIKIELTPEVAGGHYSNLAVISHSAGEFYLDFGKRRIVRHRIGERGNV